MRLPLIGLSVIAVFACATGTQAGEPPVESAAPTLTLENFDPPMFGDYTVRIPEIRTLRGAYKIAENESPRPQDRAYLNYNFFNDNKRDLAPGTEDDYRETLGLEKTVFGDASVGLRLPFFQGLHGEDFLVGDPAFVLKYAPIHNKETGNALSVGLLATVPIGEVPKRRVVAKNKDVHAAFLEPFVGYVWHRGDFFVHAFHSILVPTDFDEVAVLFNDVGVGYWVYRGDGEQLLTGVIPTLELHVNIPLNHRDANDLQRFRDAVDVTGGVHIEFKKRYLFGLAAVGQLNSPRPFDFEVIANFNWRF